MAAVFNQIDWWLPLFLPCALVSTFWETYKTDFEKGKVIMHNSLCCIQKNSQLFRNILYYNYLVSQNERIDWIHIFRSSYHCRAACLYFCCGPVKGPEERHELGITWNKYIEQKYKYSIGKRVLNVSLTAKVLGWS